MRTPPPDASSGLARLVRVRGGRRCRARPGTHLPPPSKGGGKKGGALVFCLHSMDPPGGGRAARPVGIRRGLPVECRRSSPGYAIGSGGSGGTGRKGEG